MRRTEDGDRVLYAVDNGIATITLNRPEVRNAFTDGMREALLTRLESIEAQPAVACVVITGTGEAFCAGGDVASMVELQAADSTEVLASRMSVAADVVQCIRRLPQPVIAAVNGAAAGGGMNLALACDLRFGSPRAFFAESFVRIGLVPDWGGFHFLVRLVGTARAMEAMMTGDRIDAEEALRLGLLNRIFPAESFAHDVGAFAARLAGGPLETLARIKEGVYLGAESSLADALDFEERTQRERFLSPDAREGMRAFVEKRPPRFTRGEEARDD